MSSTKFRVIDAWPVAATSPTAGVNPSSCTRTSKRPGATDATYTPSVPVTTETRSPVCSFTRTTLALGSSEPSAALTVPLIVASTAAGSAADGIDSTMTERTSADRDTTFPLIAGRSRSRCSIGRNGALHFRVPLPEVVQNGINDQFERERSDDAADHRRGDPFHHVRAGAGRP